MRGWFVAGVVGCACLVSAAASAQEPARAMTEDELRSHLAALGQKLDDLSVDVGVRARVALEMASTLDRAAASAPSPELRRDRWREAVTVLDRFAAKNPGFTQERAFQVQAAVYVWARARTWVRAVKSNPADADARKKAVEELTNCVNRLRPFYDSLGDATDVLAQNARFRMAQAYVDLAEVAGKDRPARAARYEEALEALARPVTEPSLAGFSRLLRGQALAGLGRYEEAAREVASAARTNPAPPDPEVLEAKLAVELGRKNYGVAVQAITSSTLGEPAKAAYRARIRLEERLAEPPGPRRNMAESALFAELKALKASGSPEARAALMAAADAIAEPSEESDPPAWDLLAEGALALDDPARAGSLETRAAARADTLGKRAEAAGYRLRAGAYYFQAGKFAEADPLLAAVAADPEAGASRPRAGLLLALTRGRALAMGRPGASEAAYAAALRDQIKNFPDDPSASEARWLLGKLRMAESDRDAALALWESIPHGHPRWLDSRVAIANARRHEIELLRVNNDRDAVARRLDDARSFLARAIQESQGDAETNELLLASAYLELTPVVGHPDAAQKHWERLQRSAALPAQREAARRLRLLILTQQSRWVEAEQAARQEVKLSDPDEVFALVRLLDRAAAEAESDLRSRRIGYLLRILMTRVLENPERLRPEALAEARLRNARALLFSGNEEGARRTLSSWSVPSKTPDPALLRDLAETYVKLEAYEMAVDVQRLRAKLAPTGSIPWFDARYGLALAHYRAGKPKDALHLIDATAILHPDLGGGELREKFIRLRQKIDPTH